MKKPHHGDKKWNKEAGSSFAGPPKEGWDRAYTPIVPQGLTSEEYRLWKMEESRQERLRLNKLLSEDHARIADERRKQP